MPTDDKPAENEPTTVKNEPDPDAGAKKALDDERKARRDAERQLAQVAARLKELEDADKSEADKLRDENASLTAERDTLATAVLRMEVAAEKGLNAAQAKRLVGTNRDELEADADEVLEAFPAAANPVTTPPPSIQPKPNLRGGTEPDRAGADPAQELGDFITRQLSPS